MAITNAENREDKAKVFDLIAQMAERLTAEELGQFAKENARFLRATNIRKDL